MLEVIETEAGFMVVDEEGNALNPEPFESEEEAEAFRMQLMSEENAVESGVGAPPMGMPQMPPSAPQMPMGGIEQMLGGMA